MPRKPVRPSIPDAAVPTSSPSRARARPTDDQRFRLLFDRASVGMVRFGPDGRALEANPALVRMLGYSVGELASMSFTEFTHPDDVEISASLHGELLEGKRDSYQYEKRYVRKDGEVIWCRVTVWADAQASSGSRSALGLCEEITTAKLAEVVQRERADRLERIIATQRDIAAAAGDLQQVMGVIVERAVALTRAEGAMISLIEGEDVVTRAACGIAAGFMDFRRPMSETVTRFAIEERAPLLIEHAEDDPRLNSKLRARMGDRSHICVPLLSGEEPIGALSVMSRSEHERLNEEDRQTLQLLAGVLSAGVSRAAELEAGRRQMEALAGFQAVWNGALSGVAMIAGNGRIMDANPAMLELLGARSADELRPTLGEYGHPEDRARIEAAVRDLVSGDSSSMRIEHRLLRPDGQVIWICASMSVVRDADGGLKFAIVMMQDDTERKAAEEALIRHAELNQHQALHDGLTGLPNRTLFRDRITQAIALAQREGQRVAVAMMDLDHFKDVNDSLGHHAGDVLLIEIGNRLRAALRNSDTVARLGGDEFGVLIPQSGSDQDLVRVVQRIRTALEPPVTVEDLALSAEASIGISVFPQHGGDVDTLLRHADIAMYGAKEENSPYAFYDSARGDSDPANLTLIGELRQAIDRRELVVLYQPKAALANGAVVAVEALLRWQHPVRGLMTPDQFIPQAQQTGVIKPLTLYVIDEALRQCQAWQQEGLRLGVAVNLTVRNLLDTEFPGQVRRLLRRHRVEPALLELEITESTMLSDPLRTKRVLDKLAAMGVGISIDDFGTGYSSLSYLRQLPVSEIKIDRSFVMNMETSDNDDVIVRSTVDLARNLGLQVVAEGVETAETWSRLASLGCTLAQGFYLSRPVPPEELVRWLRGRSADPERPEAAGERAA